eukprot:TRINITY_DN8038_c5_g1_i1.p1 TRINITY_DN8038_c5_g1~~TRINITY_DN8038_c5_g1_i1.p1  ORF type:complete len:118 (+),score=7.70 TRINITY_DN8038_c5_g1_i1:48-401(+)
MSVENFDEDLLPEDLKEMALAARAQSKCLVRVKGSFDGGSLCDVSISVHKGTTIAKLGQVLLKAKFPEQSEAERRSRTLAFWKLGHHEIQSSTAVRDLPQDANSWTTVGLREMETKG